MYDCGFSAGGWGWLGMVAWWVLIVLAIVWLVRALGVTGVSRHATVAPRVDDALRLLRERYARGEIDTDEFDRRRAGLE